MLLLLLQDDDGTIVETTNRVTDWLLDNGITVAAIVAFAFVAVLILHVFVPRAVRVATEKRLEGKPDEEIRQRTDTLTHVFTRSGTIALVLLAFFTSLPEFGINIAPLLAGVGVVGIALGFGAQSLVKDFLAGLFILIDNQYGKGDVVRIADITGLVEDVGLRRTVLRDMEGIVHYIPNGEITTTSNFTQEFSRVNMNISVSYVEDLDYVMEVINKVGEEMMEDPYFGPLLITPPKSLRVDSFGDSGIDVKVVGDVQPIKQWEVMGELRRRLKRRFDEVGIEIPFPHRTIVTTSKASVTPAVETNSRDESAPAPKQPSSLDEPVMDDEDDEGDD